MEQDELLKRVLMMQRLQGMETEPISAEDPYASMEKDQLISMIHFLVKREDERAQENQELKDMVKELRDTHKQDVKTQTNLLKSIDNLTSQVADLTTQNKTLQQKVNDLLSQISVGNKVRFGSKSQKGIKKNTPVQDREKDKDDFDGTNGTAISFASQSDTASVDADPEPAEQTQKSYENRIGLKYQTMNADNRIVHESDINLLPEGSTVIKSVFESTYEQVSYIVQHDYEMIIYKDKDGVMRKGYFPKAEESAEIDRIPGTHASCSLLANLVFNKYHMNTPVYREMVRLLNNKMNVSRNTVYNWFVKGSEFLNKVGEKTSKIISQIRQRLVKLFADGNSMRGDLMNKALNYLKSFWNQLILYLKDGRYCIDRSALPLGSSKNSLAERTLRPMTVERKNSLTFGSHAGAKVSVIYHTFIETCKMCGVSTLEYFKEFFKAIMQGRTDYENMLPMTIGIKK